MQKVDGRSSSRPLVGKMSPFITRRAFNCPIHCRWSTILPDGGLIITQIDVTSTSTFHGDRTHSFALFIATVLQVILPVIASQEYECIRPFDGGGEEGQVHETQT